MGIEIKHINQALNGSKEALGIIVENIDETGFQSVAADVGAD